MSDFYRFGRELREVLRGLLDLEKEVERATSFDEPELRAKTFEENFFFGELNRFVGSGGEILIKAARDKGASPTRIDIGDQLIGIGVTHLIESLSRPPGLDSFRAFDKGSGGSKIAARAFEVARKDKVEDGFEFGLSALTPSDYSELVHHVSNGTVNIPAELIPAGTMIISFLDQNPTYTLRTTQGSPGVNWAAATKGTRHWNVGIAKDTDFWIATFPSDDISLLSELSPSARVGTIRFGLSLLEGSKTIAKLRPVPCVGPSNETTFHDFCLSGYAVGTQGLDTPFPIGLRTEIVFHPEK